MVDDCQSFIADPFVFPRRPGNRPALGRIAYRIGAYPDFVEYLTRRINAAWELQGWSHRAPDDPGIALLEGAAIVGDILTFYQERYANEAFLRTARWRESVADLVRLLGYRLAPGVGGRATFAFEVKGASPLEIPAGFPLKADLEGLDKPVDFQTGETVTAYSWLSRLRLYRARNYASSLAAGALHLEIKDVDGSTATPAIDAVGLKKGDRLMLVPAEPGWTTSGSTISTDQKPPQVVKVKAVTRTLGRMLVELEAGLVEGWTLPVTAYRLGRSFRHFGHNAPATYTASSKDSSNKVTGAYEYQTYFFRHVRQNHACSNTSASIDLPGEMIPLDSEVNDLPVGSRVIVQTQVRKDSSSTKHVLTAVKKITAVRAATIGFASVNGPSTLVGLESALIRHSQLHDAEADVRDYQIFEVTSAPIALQPQATFSSSGFASGTDALCFFGLLEEVKKLAQRRVLLQHDDGRVIELRCTQHAPDFVLPAGAPDQARMWGLSFDRAPTPFTRAAFDESAPQVTVFGNLADATQGKAETEAVLGNGDARSRFQTFKLPKAPLTYLLSDGATPPQVPELDIYVGGRRWRRVDSFFGRGPLEEIYIVREAADGTSYVQFGDGETGARPPSGIKNVTARYRSGSGAHGPLKPGATPSAGQRLQGLDKVRLPGLVTGGAAPEPEDKARIAAPGKIQSLGRLVSLRDFETELLTIPGITTATAAWGLIDNVPTLTLRVLMQAGREAEFESVRATIAHYQHCRGPDRFAVAVQQAHLRYAFLDVLYAFDPRLLKADVEARLRAALGLAGDEDTAHNGVFGLYRRRLGEKEYASRIEGRLQQVEGVSWCKLTALGLFASSVTDPAATPLPGAPRSLAGQLVCSETELLQLHPSHLTLNAAPADPKGECA